MSDPVIIVEETEAGGSRRSQKPVRAGSSSAFRAALDRFPRAICVAEATPVIQWVADLDLSSKTPHGLLLLGGADAPERAVLRAVFDRVYVSDKEMRFLGRKELVDVVTSSDRDWLFIGAAPAPLLKALVLVRGNLQSLIVPFSWFTPRPNGPKPDFSDVEIIDSGQTLRLGEYEAGADAVLYELDPEFRRAQRKRAVAEDTSFGGSLRRLRLQRGLGRDAFPGIAAKTIARIERGEIKKPHASTIAVIARKLGVSPGEISTY